MILIDWADLFVIGMKVWWLPTSCFLPAAWHLASGVAKEKLSLDE